MLTTPPQSPDSATASAPEGIDEALRRANASLRASEQRYQALAENSAVGIWQITPDGRTLYINPTMRVMLELEPGDDVRGRTYHTFFTPESLATMRREHPRRAEGVSSSYEVELVGARGGRRVVVISGAPVFGPDGALESMIGTFTDITERQRVEQALRESEARLRVLVSQAPAVVWTTDADLRFTSSLGGGLAALHIRPNEVVGVTLSEFFNTDDPQFPAVAAHARALNGASSSFEQAWQGRVYESHVEPLRSDDGAVAGTIGVALDVTERKRAERDLREALDRLREANDRLEQRVRGRTAELERANEALRESEQRYANILNAQQTLVARSDPAGRITYVNEAHARTFGSKVGDSVLVRVHPDDVQVTLRAMEALSRPPYASALEQRVEVRGEWRTFLWQVGVVRDREGRIAEYQAVGFDITDRRRAEEALRESERTAREAAAFNKRLVQEVDHRVRNNLAGMIALVQAMRQKTADVAAFASAIEGRLTAMSHVHQLLSDAGWRAVELRTLVTSLLAAVEGLGCHPVPLTAEGPLVLVSPRRALPLAMVLLEWFTNSCKYGAHSVPTGRLDVTWEADPWQVRLRWRESGGPPVTGAGPPSLGTDLVQSFAALELRGRCALRYPEGGADHLLEFARD